MIREVHPGLRREDFDVFDAIFPHVEGAPPTPVAKNAEAFYEWALENNHPPIGFYSAYPGLGVLDIRALLADRESQSTTLDRLKSTAGFPGRTSQICGHWRTR